MSISTFPDELSVESACFFTKVEKFGRTDRMKTEKAIALIKCDRAPKFLVNSKEDIERASVDHLFPRSDFLRETHAIFNVEVIRLNKLKDI